MKYKIILKPGEVNGYIAECPAIPGCVSQGHTKQEALKNIKDAMNGCLQVLTLRALIRYSGLTIEQSIHLR